MCAIIINPLKGKIHVVTPIPNNENRSIEHLML